MSDNQGITPPHLRNLGNLSPQPQSVEEIHNRLINYGRYLVGSKKLTEDDYIFPDEAKSAIYNLLEEVIGATEVVPANFEKLLPDRQEQMTYKSRMWARNDLRKDQRKALKELFNVGGDK